ncbi:hypothetical protein IGI37_003147 [Enterococcus sp. AZ194]|uniref:ImmA/IrrE family metallo-endopeptidase n=1 Tax=Enterococcus sp. AZ194 TaxID=2774629 RepID=UPI003F28FD6F
MGKISALYDQEFMDKFKNQKTVFNDIDNTTDEPRIDVQLIAEKLGFEIVHDILNESGRLEGNKIFVNILDAEVRQRFTIAHEIGHFILHEAKKTKYRDSTLARYEGILDRIEEREANGFAAELLMPEKLLKRTIDEYIAKNRWTNELDNIQYEALLSDVANELDVSKSSLEFRLKNVGFIKE